MSLDRVFVFWGLALWASKIPIYRDPRARPSVRPSGLAHLRSGPKGRYHVIM